MTPTRGTIAVVVPTRNGAPFLAETLRSVMAQTRRPDAVVVVDDGSTDDTPAIAASFPSVTVLANAGSGSNPARATAIAATSSDYVALLDHDDVWFPHHLEVLAGLLDATNAPAAYSHAKYFSTVLQPEPQREVEPRLVDLWSRFPTNLVGGPSAVVVRRAAFDRIGGWPTWDRVPTDVYLWFRLADLGPLVCWPAATSGWRRHATSLSAQRYAHEPARYARDRLALLAEAVDAHAHAHPGDEGRVRSRLAVQRAVVDAFVAMCDADRPALVAALEALARIPGLDDDHVGAFRTMLANAVGQPSPSRDRIWASYAAWPRDQRALRRRVADPALAAAVVAAAGRRPRRPDQWRLPVEHGTRAALVPLAGALTRAVWRRATRRYRYSTVGDAGRARRVSST